MPVETSVAEEERRQPGWPGSQVPWRVSTDSTATPYGPSGTCQVYGFHLIIGVLETTPVTELGLPGQPDFISQGQGLAG